MSASLSATTLDLYPHSLLISNGVEFGLVKTLVGRVLAVLAPRDFGILDTFEGERSEYEDQNLLIGPLSPYNATALRTQITWLRPQLLGLSTSVGMGDRLGIATPGHIRSMRVTQGKIAPIFAQQSIREMSRTDRSPQQVMDDATWGIFEEGWQHGIGADADHLKTTADIDACLAAGYTFFTVDPSAYVDNLADSASLSQLREAVERLPADIQPKATGLKDISFNIDGLLLVFDEAILLKAIVKYGLAVAHVANMYEHLKQVAKQRLFELEVSMDETEQPTSYLEHIYITSELQRLGVKWVSFAPRYIGQFEKGVDYIGDIRAFEADIAVHAAIAQQFGPYKLSLHSGSDKFSIYPAMMRHTNGLVHLKTAGTSYLEALRTIAILDCSFFKEIYTFTREHYEYDRKSYHVSAELSRAPEPDTVKDWPGLLDQFDAREILHVTFGSVLTERTADEKRRFYDYFMSLLDSNREAYYVNLEKHFRRHLRPFLSTE